MSASSPFLRGQWPRISEKCLTSSAKPVWWGCYGRIKCSRCGAWSTLGEDATTWREETAPQSGTRADEIQGTGSGTQFYQQGQSWESCGD